MLRFSRAALARRISRLAPPGPILDVGSGDGTLLQALRARGREAIGLERDSSSDDVRACELALFDERRGEWAAVVLWHSLEHLRMPATGLDRASELLAQGGLMVVAVPNRGSWQARLFGDRWFALDIPRHVLHLHAAALIERLRARGLRVERVSYWAGGQVVFGWLHGLVGLLPGHPDLYAAIRRRAARERPISSAVRGFALVAAAALLPLAVVLAAVEVLAGAGGTVLVEARRS